jgi:hypothetical protein
MGLSRNNHIYSMADLFSLCVVQDISANFGLRASKIKFITRDEV